MKILVTGFDPFDGESINPALEATRNLPNEIKGAEIIKKEIPTVFHQSAKVLKQAIETHQPDVVVCVGQAGGRSSVTPERVAINIDDARIPDNQGAQPIDMPIREDGENAYFSSLPVKAMVKKMKEVGVKASVSNSAGTFVCNHIMYQTLYMIDKYFPSLIGGFIHVPFATEQVADKPQYPSMELADITKAIEVGIEAIVERQGKGDIQSVGGKIH
jgi:pyroglutamyl-peptidase